MDGVPLRPIVSLVDSRVQQLAHYLLTKLQPYAEAAQ